MCTRGVLCMGAPPCLSGLHAPDEGTHPRALHLEELHAAAPTPEGGRRVRRRPPLDHRVQRRALTPQITGSLAPPPQRLVPESSSHSFIFIPELNSRLDWYRLKDTHTHHVVSFHALGTDERPAYAQLCTSTLSECGSEREAHNL